MKVNLSVLLMVHYNQLHYMRELLSIFKNNDQEYTYQTIILTTFQSTMQIHGIIYFISHWPLTSQKKSKYNLI